MFFSDDGNSFFRVFASRIVVFEGFKIVYNVDDY